MIVRVEERSVRAGCKHDTLLLTLREEGGTWAKMTIPSLWKGAGFEAGESVRIDVLPPESRPEAGEYRYACRATVAGPFLLSAGGLLIEGGSEEGEEAARKGWVHAVARKGEGGEVVLALADVGGRAKRKKTSGICQKK